jgi:hypothetical protein
VRQADSPSPSDPAWEQADILLMTGLHKELQWIQKVAGLEFERHVCLGTSYLVADVKRGSRNVRIVTLRQQEKGLTSAAITAISPIPCLLILFRMSTSANVHRDCIEITKNSA